MTNSTPTEVPTGIDRVTLLERTFKSKANRDRCTERLYTCDNGLQMGARQGGPLTASDETTWEVWTMHNGIKIGESVGYMTEADMTLNVRKLAAWFDEDAA